MKLYIAGPMTGLPAFNYPAFDTAEHQLHAAGYEVLNPARRGVVEGKPWEDYLREALADVCAADGVALLPGHQNSRGVALERHVAEALGLDVRLLEVWLSPEVRLLRDVFAAPTRADVEDADTVAWLSSRVEPEGVPVPTDPAYPAWATLANDVAAAINAVRWMPLDERDQVARDLWGQGYRSTPSQVDAERDRQAERVVTAPRAMCDPMPAATEETR